MANLLAYLWSWCTPTTFIVYVILCILPAVYMSKQAKKFKGNEELNKKYWPWHRYDVANWKAHRLALDNFIFLGPIRFGVAWCVVLCFTTLIFIVMIGQSKTEPLAKWRERFLRLTIKPHTRLHMLMCGVSWIKYNRRSDVNYEKYLGPDWKPSFEGAGLQVCNHQCWLDIMLLLFTEFPSFIADSAVRDLPGIGIIAVSA